MSFSVEPSVAAERESLESREQREPLPAVDERLVAAQSRYEVEDWRVRYVAPSDEPHGVLHSKILALVEAHADEAYEVACDMLTRTSLKDDVAPDVSVFPRARHPETGGRQLEELAFEVVSTERLSDAAKKAQKLSNRGVRRVFAVDVERQRAFEWSQDLGTWAILKESDSVEDRAFAVPLPLAALVRAAKTDDAVARALLIKRNPVLIAEVARGEARAAKLVARALGKAQGVDAILSVLQQRGIAVSGQERERLLALPRQALEDVLIAAVSCKAVSELFEE